MPFFDYQWSLLLSLSLSYIPSCCISYLLLLYNANAERIDDEAADGRAQQSSTGAPHFTDQYHCPIGIDWHQWRQKFKQRNRFATHSYHRGTVKSFYSERLKVFWKWYCYLNDVHMWVHMCMRVYRPLKGEKGEIGLHLLDDVSRDAIYTRAR